MMGRAVGGRVCFKKRARRQCVQSLPLQRCSRGAPPGIGQQPPSQPGASHPTESHPNLVELEHQVLNLPLRHRLTLQRHRKRTGRRAQCRQPQRVGQRLGKSHAATGHASPTNQTRPQRPPEHNPPWWRALPRSWWRERPHRPSCVQTDPSPWLLLTVGGVLLHARSGATDAAAAAAALRHG